MSSSFGYARAQISSPSQALAPACPTPPKFRRSPPKAIPIFRRSTACVSRRVRPASAIRAAPTSCWRCSTRAPRSRASSPRRNAPSAPVDWCRARLEARQGARACRQFRQCQCLHRQDRREGGDAAPPRSPPRRPACSAEDVFLASTGVIGEPLDATQIRRRLREARRRRHAERALRGGQGDHDHRHVPQGRDGDGRDRWRRSDDRRHRQGRRHDRAGYGDHAVLRLYRRADRRRGSAEAAATRASRHSFNAITIDGDTSTSDTLLLFATGAAAERGAPKINSSARPAAQGLPPRRSMSVLRDLAFQVVRDGEGARKFVSIDRRRRRVKNRRRRSPYRSPIRRW